MKPLELNTTYKHHFLIALIISVWLVLFLVLIAPFDASDLSFRIRLILMPFYGVISFVSYGLLIPLQNWVYQKINKWTLTLEILFILLFNIVVSIGCFFYYKSDMINGDYELTKFLFEVYYPIFFILLTILIALRWFLFKRIKKEVITEIIEPTHQKIILTGDNKLDTLQINFADLVCVSSAGNYVEIRYLQEGILKKKLLRNTLKNIQGEATDLMKIHRSHLINPSHFIEWKNATTIVLTQMEAPVSKSYKQAVLALDSHP